MQQKVSEAIGTLRLPDRYAAVHIRLGDKVFGEGPREAKVQPFENYVKGLMRAEVEHCDNTWDTVVVCSDDWSAAEGFAAAAASYGKSWDVRSASLNVGAGGKAPSHGGHEQELFNNMSAADRLDATIQLFAEIQVMASAQSLVCTYSSNVTRFVALLRDNPTISLDGEWHNNN